MIVAGGQGERFPLGPNTVRVVAEQEEYAFVEGEFAVGAPGPPRHRHDWDEALYVIEGKLAVTIGGGTTIAWPGDFVLVPGGVAHTFAVHGSEPARFLGFFGAAAGLDYIRALAAAAGPEAAAEVRDRYGVESV